MREGTVNCLIWLGTEFIRVQSPTGKVAQVPRAANAALEWEWQQGVPLETTFIDPVSNKPAAARRCQLLRKTLELLIPMVLK